MKRIIIPIRDYDVDTIDTVVATGNDLTFIRAEDSEGEEYEVVFISDDTMDVTVEDVDDAD